MVRNSYQKEISMYMHIMGKDLIIILFYNKVCWNLLRSFIMVVFLRYQLESWLIHLFISDAQCHIYKVVWEGYVSRIISQINGVKVQWIMMK